MASDVKQITISELMSELDRIGFELEPDLGRCADWRPQSVEGKQIFQELTSLDNRNALRQWYVQLRDVRLNRSALLLKSSLESVIREKLG